MIWEPTDYESEDDERLAADEAKKRVDVFEKKCKLLKNFTEAETLDDAHKWMTQINKFEERHLKLPLEYRVIGDMMNHLKESLGKERFILLQKLNRAVRLMECKEAYDPNNPENFGVIQHQQVGSPEDLVDNDVFENEKQRIREANLDENDESFNEMKDKDDVLIVKFNAVEKKIEEKLAILDHTFGKKGRALEEEIKELIEERNYLSEKKRRPLYRKRCHGMEEGNKSLIMPQMEHPALTQSIGIPVTSVSYAEEKLHGHLKSPSPLIKLARSWSSSKQNKKDYIVQWIRNFRKRAYNYLRDVKQHGIPLAWSSVRWDEGSRQDSGNCIV